MKNLFIIGLTAVLAAVISFAGCEPIENSSQIPQENAAKIEAAKNDLAIPAETVSDLDLPAVLNGVAISWASSDEAVISSAGHVTMGLYEAAATLTATLALGGASDTKEFDVTVPAVVEEKAKLIETQHGAMSSADSVVMTMGLLDENIVFMCSVDRGTLHVVLTPRPLFKNLNVRSGESVMWIGREDLGDGSLVNEAFVEIILKLEQNIVGYAVVWCTRNYGVVLRPVLFPQIDGKYQNVSEEYVKTAFEEVRANYWDYASMGGSR